jgi:hypothetical protein
VLGINKSNVTFYEHLCIIIYNYSFHSMRCIIIPKFYRVDDIVNHLLLRHVRSFISYILFSPFFLRDVYEMQKQPIKFVCESNVQCKHHKYFFCAYVVSKSSFSLIISMFMLIRCKSCLFYDNAEA